MQGNSPVISLSNLLLTFTDPVQFSCTILTIATSMKNPRTCIPIRHLLSRIPYDSASKPPPEAICQHLACRGRQRCVGTTIAPQSSALVCVDGGQSRSLSGGRLSADSALGAGQAPPGRASLAAAAPPSTFAWLLKETLAWPQSLHSLEIRIGNRLQFAQPWEVIACSHCQPNSSASWAELVCESSGWWQSRCPHQQAGTPTG